jgi:hypothetical protein
MLFRKDMDAPRSFKRGNRQTTSLLRSMPCRPLPKRPTWAPGDAARAERATQDIALAEAVRDEAARQYTGEDGSTDGEIAMFDNIHTMNVVKIILAMRAKSKGGA